MAATKRTPTQREYDLGRITTLYLTGHSQRDIAKVIGLDQAQINYDLKEIRKRWRESSLVEFNEAKHRELARIDELETAYWDAWRRSTVELVRTTQRRGTRDEDAPAPTKGAAKSILPKTFEEATVVKEQQVGNPAFLTGVQWCIEQRCKILGIYEATKISFDWRKAVEEQGYDAAAILEGIIEGYARQLERDADGETAP